MSEDYDRQEMIGLKSTSWAPLTHQALNLASVFAIPRMYTITRPW
jgi:hypothetical protein